MTDLENLDAYRARTQFMWDSLPHGGDFCTSPGLLNKVDESGTFKPFYGDTVIFSLDENTIGWFRELQDALYAAFGDFLADRLDPETFHITLHDLKNRPGSMPEDIAENRQQVRPIIENAGARCPGEIVLNSCCTFSMVNTSIVMGFTPKSEADCAVLMQLYDEFQSVVPLSYPLTLHATLAYYRPGCYDEETLHTLRHALSTIGREATEVRLNLNQLNYATFENMNSYSIITTGVTS